jgi:hypothetical protein
MNVCMLMHACRLVCAPECPGLCDVSISSMYGAVVVSWQHPDAVCAAALPGLLHVFYFFVNALISVPCCQGWLLPCSKPC